MWFKKPPAASSVRAFAVHPALTRATSRSVLLPPSTPLVLADLPVRCGLHSSRLTALVACLSQMMAAYSWQMYMQAAAMQSAGGAAGMAGMAGMAMPGMAGMAGMPMPVPMPFMPSPMFMHPDIMSAYGYAPFDYRKRPRDWDNGGARRRRRHDNKVSAAAWVLCNTTKVCTTGRVLCAS